MTSIGQMGSWSGTLHRIEPGTEELAGTTGQIRVARAACNHQIHLAEDNPPPTRECRRCFPGKIV